jgi:hypothetical protein
MIDALNSEDLVELVTRVSAEMDKRLSAAQVVPAGAVANEAATV